MSPGGQPHALGQLRVTDSESTYVAWRPRDCVNTDRVEQCDEGFVNSTAHSDSLLLLRHLTSGGDDEEGVEIIAAENICR